MKTIAGLLLTLNCLLAARAAPAFKVGVHGLEARLPASGEVVGSALCPNKG
jgi:hypothetical protein